MYGGRLQVPKMQPLHHPHGLEACWRVEINALILWAAGPRDQAPNPLLYGLFTHSWWETVYILGPKHTPKSAAGFLQLEVKEICVSVGTRRRRGGQRRARGGGPLRAPGFPAGGTWIPFLDQWRVLCRAWHGEEPEGCRRTMAPGLSGSALHGHTLAHGVPAAAPGGWNYSYFLIRNQKLRELRQLVPFNMAGEYPGGIQSTLAEAKADVSPLLLLVTGAP